MGMLERAGWTCELATTPREFLTKSDGGEFDLVFVDLETPHADVEMLTEQLKLRRPQTPVITVSAQDDDQIMKHSFRHGSALFLLKPVSSDTLAGVLKEFFG